MIIKKSFVLAIGQTINKILGIIFIYMFSNNATDASIYTSSYLVFSLFADLATLGLIPGTSKLVSKMDEQEQEQFLAFGRKLTILLGVLYFILFFIGLKPMSMLTLNDNYLALGLVSINLLVLPRYYFNRGFLQGKMKMTPSAISMVVEAICRILLLLLFLYVPKTSGIIEYMALLCNFIAVIFGNYILRIGLNDITPKKGKNYYVQYFNVCLPYGMTTLFFTLYQAVDIFSLKRLMVDSSELIINTYLYQANRLIYLPVMIASSFAACLIPSLKNETENKDKVIHDIFIYLNAILIFFVGCYLLFSFEIFSSLYPTSMDAFYILSHLAYLVLLLGVYKIILGILHGLGKVSGIVCFTWISFVLKYILNTLWIPQIGYKGATYATIICLLLCLSVGIGIIKMNKIAIIKNMFKTAFKYAAIFIISFILLYFGKSFMPQSLTQSYSLTLDLSILSLLYVSIIITTMLWKLK